MQGKELEALLEAEKASGIETLAACERKLGTREMELFEANKMIRELGAQQAYCVKEADLKTTETLMLCREELREANQVIRELGAQQASVDSERGNIEKGEQERMMLVQRELTEVKRNRERGNEPLILIISLYGRCE